jgi:hypothetical protein
METLVKPRATDIGFRASVIKYSRGDMGKSKQRKKKSESAAQTKYKAPSDFVVRPVPNLGGVVTTRDIEFVTEDCDIQYADLFTVQNYPTEFILTFFQTAHPLLFTEKDLRDSSKLTAYCTYRVSLPPPLMLEFADALKTNVEAWKKRMADMGDAEPGTSPPSD